MCSCNKEFRTLHSSTQSGQTAETRELSAIISNTCSCWMFPPRWNVPRKAIQEIYQLSRVMTSSRTLKNVRGVRSGAGRRQKVMPKKKNLTHIQIITTNCTDFHLPNKQRWVGHLYLYDLARIQSQTRCFTQPWLLAANSAWQTEMKCKSSKSLAFCREKIRKRSVSGDVILVQLSINLVPRSGKIQMTFKVRVSMKNFEVSIALKSS